MAEAHTFPVQIDGKNIKNFQSKCANEKGDIVWAPIEVFSGSNKKHYVKARINKIEDVEMPGTGEVVETLYIVRVDGQSSVCVCLPRASLRFVFAFSLCCGQRGGRVCIAVCVAANGTKIRKSEEKCVPSHQCGLPKMHTFWRP